MPPVLSRVLVCCVVLLALGSCSGCVEKLVPGRVATGVARLSTRHAAYLTKAMEADTRCGFASDVVQRGVLLQGQAGQEGAAVWKVQDCRLSFAAPTVVSTDCLGVEATLLGTVTVSATKRVLGTLTGDPTNPVIPNGADAATVEVDAVFEDLTVRTSASPAWLQTLSGGLHYVISPRVALSRSLGICAVTTLDLSLSEIRYDNVQAVMSDGDRTFAVEVNASDFEAQIGRWESEENSFSGSVTVWTSEQAVPTEGDTDGLDAEYTRESYFDAISCNPDLATPVSYACPSLKDQLVHGAARLSIAQLGAVTSLIDGDTRCGFSSSGVLAGASLSGTTGGPGSATFTLAGPCTLTFPTLTPIGTNCAGVVQSAVGRVTVTGTKTLTGRLTGDVNQPVAPDSVGPAVLRLTVQPDRFQVVDSASPGQSLTSVSGTLTATVKPRVAVDTRTGICSYATPVVEFADVAWNNAALEVTTQGFTFQVDVSQSALQAQSGTKGDRTNYLEGVMVSGGQVVTVPPPGAAPVLDPSYDAAQYEASFSCKPGLQVAADDAACSIDNALATNAARLVLLAFGTTASQIQNDTTCGFSALSVKTMPTSVTGNDGEMGVLEWNLQGCTLGSAGVSQLDVDCLGATKYRGGTANVAAQRVVTGERDTELLIFDSVIPRTRDAMRITVRPTALAEYQVYTVEPGETEPFARLVIHSGTMLGQVVPALGERASKPGVFDVGTPVATFTGIELRDAAVSLTVDGKRFDFVIDAAQLSGQHGTFRGVSNVVSGVVAVRGGATITIPAGTMLDPSFVQTEFDAAYACTADLRGLVPPN